MATNSTAISYPTQAATSPKNLLVVLGRSSSRRSSSYPALVISRITRLAMGPRRACP